MEVLLHRLLGNAITMPYEMHNKIGLYDLAHEDMKGECMQRQLQIALLHRDQSGGSNSMEHQFTLEEITRHGGLMDHAFLRYFGLLDTYKLPTNSHERKLDVLTPMATALYEQLRKKKQCQWKTLRNSSKRKKTTQH